MIRFALILASLAASLACGQTVEPRLVVPDAWPTWDVPRKCRYLTALQEKLRVAHNDLAAKDPATARRLVMPRVRTVAARLAELREKLPEVKGQFAVRWDRKARLAAMTAAEIAVSDPVAAFPDATLAVEPPDPTEDLTTYTETDPNSDFTVAASLITVATMAYNVDAYVYRDCTAGHFGDFVHLFEAKATAATDTVAGTAWAVANTVDDGVAWYNASAQTAGGFLLWSAGTGWRIYVRDYENQGGDQDYADITVNTQYYLTATRSGTSLTIAIYSNAGRTTLVDTVACTLAAGRTYRYVFAVGSHNAAATQTISYTFGNLDLGEAAATTVPLHILYRNVPHLRGGPATPWRTGP